MLLGRTSLPLVTIVVLSYNNYRYLGQTLSSILNQSYTQLEVIVLDDASTDASRELVDQFIHTDSRVSLVVNPVNLGAFGNSQKSQTLGKGDYWIVLGSDDYLFS